MTVEGDVATCHVENAAAALRELLRWAAANGLGDLEDLPVVRWH